LPSGIRADLDAIVAAALGAADAAEATRRTCDLHTVALRDRRIRLLAAGKAAAAMARAFVQAAPGSSVEGVVIAPPRHEGDDELPASLVFHAASHPVPDERSEMAGRAALALAARIAPQELLVVLLSGGASALMAVPAPGLTLADKQDVTARLLARGADITALNTVRKHLSAIKGGRLAAACRGDLIAWALSDVVGDDLSVIASGPTVPDGTTLADARAVLQRFGPTDDYPAAVKAHLERADLAAETPKAGDPVFERAETTVIGSARLSLDGAAEAARALGYRVMIRETPVVGEARDAARAHAEWLIGLPELPNPAQPLCILSSGETTVTVTGRGRGGRNQEFALALAPWLSRGPLVAASVGTDGVDGPTDAAGAYVDGTTISRAKDRGLDWRVALDANDAWTFFASLGDLIRTGPTGTNVGDIQVVLARPAGEAR
jgi:hydroxypyruvate reductase